MRLVDLRLLEGPNVYRLEPTAKIEVVVGRRRSWYGTRQPGAHSLVELGRVIRPSAAPGPIRDLAAWVRRLHRLSAADAWLRDAPVATGRRRPKLAVAIHGSSEPGHWIVSFPWREHERALELAEAAWRLTELGIDPRATRIARSRRLAGLVERIRSAGATPPPWVTDAERRVPIVSISGTNGKSTTTRMIAAIMAATGRRVGMTTSDGVIVAGRVIEPGDWTGPGGARLILDRSDIDVAVLETARGGILLKGVGYESNDASVLTNVTADHLDLQGIHTLPELAEVKATIARITRPDGAVVLNAADPLLVGLARRFRAPVTYFSLGGMRDRVVRRHLARGGRAFVVEGGWLVEAVGARRTRLLPVADAPATLHGLAAHNIANALGAAAAARALGASIEEVGEGLRRYRPSAAEAPGRLNLYRLGDRVIIIDFAHNEAGVAVLLDVADGIAAGAAGRRRPVTLIMGTAGDRPDDALRAVARLAGRRADHVVIKETLHYLRGRTRESILGEFRAGLAEAGVAVAKVPIYDDEVAALTAVLTRGNGNGANEPAVVALMCHEDRPGVEAQLAALGARPIDPLTELPELVPRLQARPYR
ncbi:MAG: Mur ligase family protein [Candidatus Limnocylindrales bacterium]